MLIQKRDISPTLYFIIISFLTDLLYIVVGAVIIIIISIRSWKTWAPIFSFFLLWKGVLVGIAVRLLYKDPDKKDYLIKFIGSYYGRFFGLIFGAYLGSLLFNTFEIESVIGFIIGALALFFLGGWKGSVVSNVIALKVDKILSFSVVNEPINYENLNINRKIAILAHIIPVIVPLISILIAIVMKYSNIDVAEFSQYKSLGRIIAIILSIYSISFPWLMKNKLKTDFTRKRPSLGTSSLWLGLTFSYVPSAYGLILFILTGISIYELFVYAIVSSIMGSIWVIYSLDRKENN